MEYWERVQSGDKLAFEEYVANNDSLIRHMVKGSNTLGKKVEYEDLYQEALIASYKALCNFKPGGKASFNTYLCNYIKFTLKTYVWQNGYAIRPPRTLYDWVPSVAKDLKKGMSVEEASEKNGVSISDISFYLSMANPDTSVFSLFHKTCDGNGHSSESYLIDILCNKEDDPYKAVDWKVDIERLSYSEKERELVNHLIENDMDFGMTQKEFGEIMGIHQGSVSRVQKKLLKKLMMA